MIGRTNATGVGTVPRPNLLDNSDFTNPVNLRGVTDYTSYANQKYFVDRWFKRGTATTPLILTDDGLQLSGNGSSSYEAIRQILSAGKLTLAGKTVTAAVKIKSLTGSARLRISAGTTPPSDNVLYGQTIFDEPGIHIVSATVPDDMAGLYLGVSVAVYEGATATIEWAALYEGEYTAATLPEYQPKGYAAELAACAQYNSHTGEYKGAYSMDLLWENASPTSDFAAQTLALDLSGYDFYMVTAVAATTYPYRISTILPTGNGGLLSYAWGDSGTNVHRSFAWAANGIQFYGAYYNKTPCTNHSVPLAIYGIKGVG